MGGVRKRLLERPTGQPIEGEVRKKKKGKKFKERKESISSEPTHKPLMESTATTEGRIMAQVCSTFSRIEQSRFEAFRRAAFPGDAISKYVAQCLIDEHGETKRSPILSEVVAPGQAEEICIVVSTLAKAYAQRLVTAARTLAGSPNEAIEPEHILQVFQERQSRGQDPGFFLQAAGSKTVLKDDKYRRKRLAALKAQDDHDKLHPLATTKENADDNKDDPMEISTPPKP